LGKRLFVTYFITILAIAVAWEALSLVMGSMLLPGPWAVFQRLPTEVSQPVFWEHAAASAWRISAGLALAFIIAVPLGLLLGGNRRMDRIFEPLIYLSYPIPKIVILPIILLIFGLGDGGKIALITLIIVFQLLIPTRDAARTVDSAVIHSFRSLGGNRRQYYRHVVWPVAMPAVFSALRIGTGTAVAVLFFVESISTHRGLGLYLIDNWGRADYPAMFVGIIALSAIGIILYETFDFLEKKLCRWRNA
jgi:NitT/TauT family transport system permease protein